MCCITDMLLTEPLSRDETQLPSPEALKRKIILKVGYTLWYSTTWLYNQSYLGDSVQVFIKYIIFWMHQAADYNARLFMICPKK